MFKVEQLAINPDTPAELQKISTDLVGYVIDKATKKVISVNVITRRAILDWYKGVTDKYATKDYHFCIASICLIGTLVGIQVTEVEEKKSDDDGNNKDGKKSKYMYHVN